MAKDKEMDDANQKAKVIAHNIIGMGIPDSIFIGHDGKSGIALSFVQGDEATLMDMVSQVLANNEAYYKFFSDCVYNAKILKDYKPDPTKLN